MESSFNEFKEQVDKKLNLVRENLIKLNRVIEEVFFTIRKNKSRIKILRTKWENIIRLNKSFNWLLKTKFKPNKKLKPEPFVLSTIRFLWFDPNYQEKTAIDKRPLKIWPNVLNLIFKKFQKKSKCQVKIDKTKIKMV